MYYAEINAWAAGTSTGFINTWSCVAFATRALRDRYVDEADDMATRPCRRDIARRYFVRDAWGDARPRVTWPPIKSLASSHIGQAQKYF